MRKWRWRGAGITIGTVVASVAAVAGQWRGGLAGAGLIAGGGFLAPEVSAWLQTRRQHTIDLDQVSSPAVLPPAGRAPGWARDGAARWLRPDQQVVGFIDRPELALLLQWCADADAPPLMLLTGAGGVGKTRLALRLAAELQDAGWLCRLVRQDGEAAVTGAARAVSTGRVLLIVDYAETRASLTELLRAAAADDGGRLRVLLLARGAGEWWAQLQASPDIDVRLLAASAGPVAVSTAVGQVAVSTAVGPENGGADQVRAAIPEFARALEVAVPDPAEVVTPPGPVPILVLHAAALLAVLETQDHPQPDAIRVVAEEVLTDLLRREGAFWLGSAKAAELTGPGGVDSATLAQAVAIACLIAVADETQAAQALRNVPGLADAPAGQRRRIARWLRQLYPADPPRWWGSLQPDLLAEQHAVTQLDAAPDLAAACLRDMTDEQARGALTVLARACAHLARASGLIAAALRADLAGLGIPAIAVAVQTGGSLGGILADVLREADAPLETLIRIEEEIPYPTVALAVAHAAVAERIIRMLPEDADRAKIALRHDQLGLFLSQAGRHHQALLHAEKAVAIWRELTAGNPDQHRPDLAEALINFGGRLSHLGRPAKALTVTEEAVAILRELAASPDKYAELAGALTNLGSCLAELGDAANALPATEEAVAMYRELAATNPDDYRADLASALINLGDRFAELGRRAEALTITQEAVTIRRQLAATNPDRHNPLLAWSLDNLSARFSELGHPIEALTIAREGVTIRRELAAINPDLYRPLLADSLTNLGDVLLALKRTAAADAARLEATAIRDGT